MTSRRLIAAPAIVLVAVTLVAAVIDAGQQSRAAAFGGDTTRIADLSIAAEQGRIDALLQADRRCVGALDCDRSRAGARTRRAAADVRTWPADARFHESRRLLQAQLLARADLLDQESMAAVDGRTSPLEAERLRELRRIHADAARTAAQARLAAGVLDREQYEQLLANLRR
jgi:hypothetical protein